MKPVSLGSVAVALTAAGCAPAPVKRCAMITGLKPDREAYYRELHARPWPGVIAKLRECNIRNYSIHRAEIGGKPYLFSYFEYTGKDFDADMKAMAADPETRRWWKETDPCQSPLPDALGKGQIWSVAEEVFYAP